MPAIWIKLLVSMKGLKLVNELAGKLCSTYPVTPCVHSTQQQTFCLYLLLKELCHGPRILKTLANFFMSVACDPSKSRQSLSFLFFCITILVLSHLKEIIILIFLSVKK